MSSSEIQYHLDEEGEQVIAERDGRAIGVMPWSVDGKSVTFGRVGFPVCVAPHERRQGIGTAMTDLAREKFPKSEGYTITSTPAISATMRTVLFKDSMEKNRKAWFDHIGDEEASEVSTPEITRILNLVQQDLDRLLGE